MMISEWAIYGYYNQKYNNICINLTTTALENLVIQKDNEHPLGSWKDIKYFCNYWSEISPYPNKKDDPIFQKALDLICKQLSFDATHISTKRSLVAKWIPREKSKKFGWLTKELAYYYFGHYLTNAKNSYTLYQAQKKCLTEFRKLVASINKELQTTQINQCANDWETINFDKNVTSITMRKQSYAFQNKTKKNIDRYHSTIEKETDRQMCAEHYKKYVEMCADKPEKAKGKNISMTSFVKSALEAQDNTIEKSIINSQWINNALNTDKLENMIAMVDTSGSMECDHAKPLYTAIGLGLRVAEKSTFGKRIMTFSATPTWVNLDDCDNFVDSVKKIRKANWGMNTNFRAALDLILDAAIAQNIEPDKMENLILAIFSDMQIDQATMDYSNTKYVSTDTDTMFEMMSEKYKIAGLRSKYKTPYPLPHILFWNLRTTDGFPNLSSTKNTSMLSGASPNSLNLFSEKGIEGLKEITPWNMLQECLKNKRYDELDTALNMAWKELVAFNI